jgi:hypothetical protein
MAQQDMDNANGVVVDSNFIYSKNTSYYRTTTYTWPAIGIAVGAESWPVQLRHSACAAYGLSCLTSSCYRSGRSATNVQRDHQEQPPCWHQRHLQLLQRHRTSPSYGLRVCVVRGAWCVVRVCVCAWCVVRGACVRGAWCVCAWCVVRVCVCACVRVCVCACVRVCEVRGEC